MTQPASYAELGEWTQNFEVGEFILDAELTLCLVRDLVELCRPHYTAEEVACLKWIRQTPEPWAPSDERTAIMTPIWTKRWSTDHAGAARAEFLGYSASNMPLEFQYAGILIFLCQRPAIPFGDAIAAFQRYIPSLR